MHEIGVYVHIPFCRRRCGYCDFNTYAGFSHAIPSYVKALGQEIELTAKNQPHDTLVTSIYFGGGTPSLLNVEQLNFILEKIQKNFAISTDVECSMEANPGTVDQNYLHELKQIGFSRLSFGMQSAHPQDLARLNRQHRFEDVVNAVKWTQEAGIGHINLDLIFAIPGQTLPMWQENLQLVSHFPIDHLSLYSLIIEEGTPLAKWYARGLVENQDDDLAGDMYEWAMDFLAKEGLTQYEISNWAKVEEKGSDGRCRHNLNTWRFLPYYGFGAGAHGFIGHTRTENVPTIPEYLKRMSAPESEWPAAIQTDSLDIWTEMQEWMMVGFRKTEEGISEEMFYQRFGIPCRKVFGKQLSWCEQNGLIETMIHETKSRLRLTRKGRLLGNQVFMQFVGNERPEGI